MNPSFADLRRRFAALGQEHVFRFWDRLDETERQTLVRELQELDDELLATLAPMARVPKAERPSTFEPAEVISPGTETTRGHDLHRARARGAELLAHGRVGLVLVAGGQATRLGYDQPKGMFPIGPASGRTLFELHAHRILAIARRTGHAPPWFVMTSPQNDAATRAYFEEKRWFGLPPGKIVLFPQATVPAFDRHGRLVLETPSRLFRNPNGHGGAFSALADSGFLERCREDGITQLFYWQVDNPLVNIADPLFLGLHDEAGAGMSSKVVSKRDAEEKVGVLGRANGKLACIEYSDLPPELRYAVDSRGRLLYRAGNIAIHAIAVEFAMRLTSAGAAHTLPWHRAEKKVKSVTDDGQPTEIPGVKFETFVFDALGLSPTSITLEVRREDEFAPVKNASGEDSPETAKAAMSAYYARWLREAMGEEPASHAHPIEVHPQFALDLEEFREHLAHVPKRSGAPLFVDARHAPRHPGRHLRVAVAMGGQSPERGVSMRSGAAVLSALDPAKYRALPLELRADGLWALAEHPARSAANAIRLLRHEGIDVVFLALHGPGGEDGVVQGFLETAGIPYTGCGVAASALAMDKVLTRAVLSRAGLRVSSAVEMHRYEWEHDRSSILARIGALRAPLFVKAPNQGSSYGVVRVDRSLGNSDGREAVEKAVASVLRYEDRVLVEEGVEGVEITIPVLGNCGDPMLEPLLPVEIRPRSAAFFDTHEKYASTGAEEICPPRSLSAAQVAHAQKLGAAAHRALLCDGMSRTDMICSSEGFTILEVNTIPGLTERSLLPQSAAASGIPFPDLLHRILHLALEKRAPHLLRISP
ncbi:MAG: UTP--glucose-1-phosphate uridylyltransferase [Planctomycetes bacterium]|nr:UTP--glucose-1-phosphate uridylyltransferase [Planctomycetota bacterium]